MESVELYEKSNAELAKIRKTMASSSTLIEWDSIDGETKVLLVAAMNDVIIKRQHEIQKVILGVQ